MRESLGAQGQDNKGRLRRALEDAIALAGCNMQDLTVLAARNDPFRVDTPAKHRDGAWVADWANRLGLGDREIHPRGLHYMLLSGQAVKPDGFPYTGSNDDSNWLENKAVKYARWLGYLPFEQIVDHRNSPPVIRIFERLEPEPYVAVDVEIPEPDDLKPQVGIAGFHGVQPFKLVLFGEKSSLEEVLAPIAESRQADLYLPSGEISDWMLYRMARVGADDGRRMVVLCFCDCDPGGWQMPISIGRKLQAFRVLDFPDLDFEVRRVAVTPDQVREYGFPSSPLKEKERRKDRWLELMGVEQTEIDALAALQPDLLRQMALDAISPFYDASLDQRVADARREWVKAARAALGEQLDMELLEQLQQNAQERLAELENDIAELADEISGDLTFPAAEVPEPEISALADGDPLIDSDWSFADQSRRLKASKAYEDEDDE